MSPRSSCEECPWILDILMSCPRFVWFKHHSMTTEIVDLIFVLSSLTAYVVALFIIVKMLVRRNLFYLIFFCTSVGLVGIRA